MMMVLAVAIAAISPYCESFVSFCDLPALVETDQLPPGHFVFMTAMVKDLYQAPVFEGDIEHHNRSEHCQDEEAPNTVTDWAFYSNLVNLI